MRYEDEAGGAGAAGGGGTGAGAGDAAAAAASAAASAGAASAGAAGAGEFKPETAVTFFTEHGVDPKTLEGVKPEELKSRYESAKAIADKATERATKGAQKAPEKYDAFKAPDGVTLDAEVAKEFEAFAREANLPQDKAQKGFDIGLKLQQRFAAQTQAQVAKVHEGWAQQAQADKEYGGEKLQENLAIAKEGMKAFATPEFVQWLNDSKLGNHPEMNRVFFRIGKAMKEDKIVGQQGSQRTEGDIASRLYGKTQGK
jgi:hypothetical protein